jgi:hypothetical protein
VSDDEVRLSLFSGKSPVEACLSERAGLFFRGLFLIYIHEFGLIVRQSVKKSGGSVGKIRIRAQRERELVWRKVASVKASGVKRISGGEMDLLKCFGFEVGIPMKPIGIPN